MRTHRWNPFYGNKTPRPVLLALTAAVFMAWAATARAQTQVQAVNMSLSLPPGWTAESNPGEFRYQPSAQPAVFVARSGDLVFFIISHDIGGGSINDIGASYDAYYRTLLGQEPASAYRYTGGRVLYHAAYSGPGRSIGFLLPEHKDIPLAAVNLWGVTAGRGIGIYFQCPYSSYQKHRDAIESAIRSFQFQGEADKRETLLLKSREFGGMVAGNPHDPGAPAPAADKDLPRMPSDAPPMASSSSSSHSLVTEVPGAARPSGGACEISPGEMDALAGAAKGDCDLAVFLKLMQSASPEERRLIRNFLEAMRGGK